MQERIASLSRWREGPQLIGLQNRHEFYQISTIPTSLNREDLQGTKKANAGSAVASAMIINPDDTKLVVAGGPMFDESTVEVMSLVKNTSAIWQLSPSSLNQFPYDGPVTSMDWVGGSHNVVCFGSNNGRIVVSSAKDLVGSHGTSLPLKCTLRCPGKTKPIYSTKIGPSDSVPSTLVKCLTCHPTNTNELLASKEERFFLWDLRKLATEGDPVLMGIADGMISTAAWCPTAPSSAVVLIGTVNGTVSCFDCRAPQEAVQWEVKGSATQQQKGIVTGIEFSKGNENLVLTSSLAGFVAIHDVRNASMPLMEFSTNQRGIMSCCWLPLHNDLLATGGLDGTVKLWNIRCAPSYLASTNQFDCGPITSLKCTQTRSKQRIFALGTGGDINVIEPTAKALYQLAPTDLFAPPTQTSVSSPTDSSLEDAEMKAVQYLYARQPSKAHEKILQSIVQRLARKESQRAAELLALLHEPDIIAFGWKKKMPSEPLDELREELGDSLNSITAVAAIPTRVSQGLVVDLDKTPPAVDQRLKAVRVNVIIGALVDSRDTSAMLSRLPLLRELVRSGGAHMAECVPLIVDVVNLLIEECPIDGMLLIQSLVDDCLAAAKDLSIDDPVAVPVRSILLHFCSPAVIDVNVKESAKAVVKRAKRICDDFFANPEYIRSAIRFELKLQRLTLTSTDPSLAIKLGREFDAEHEGTGVARLIALSPVHLYLNSLLASAEYVSFFWAAATWYERHKLLPNAKTVRDLHERELNRFVGTLTKMTSSLRAIVGTDSTHSAAVDTAVRVLRRFHPFVLATVRTVIEIEMSAPEDLEVFPELVDIVVAAIDDAMADALDVWSQLLDLMHSNRFSATTLRDPIQSFKREVQQMMRELNAHEDQTLQPILEECQAFISGR